MTVATRRDVLRAGALAGGGLLIGFRLPGLDEPAAAAGAFRPNAWLRLEPDGRVVVVVGKSEMGQGVRTALPMIAAEELDVPFERVALEQARPGPDYPGLGTGGSSSLMTSWDPLRRAGAAARELLVAAAAARWGVAPDGCSTAPGRVVHAASGRTIDYRELLDEAAALPVPEAPRHRPRSEWRLLGGDPARPDEAALLTGRALFGADVRPPGLRFAVLARPPAIGAPDVAFDREAALAVPGVEACFPVTRGVAVVARSTWAALRGREALDVSWGAGPNAAFSSDAHAAALRAAAGEPGIETRRDGDPARAFAGAARRLDALYEYPFEAHAAIEPVVATAQVRDGRCEIWSPTQTPNAVQAYVARQLGIAREAVTVNVTLLGGGFGRRLGWDMELDAAEVAARVDHPVQLFWSREDDLRNGYFQAAAAHRMAAGLDRAGRLVAWEQRKASTPHNARGRATAEELADPEVVRSFSWGVVDNPYAIPALRTAYRVVEAPVPIGPWRAVFSPSSVFARESFLDEIALAAKRDPLELRRELLGAGDPAIPAVVEPGGERVDRRRLRAVLETAAERAGWLAPVATGRARGIACNVFHTETYVAYVAEVSLRERPGPDELPFRVERVVAAVDCGVVVHPEGARRQVESGIVWALSNLKTEVRFAAGGPTLSNFDDFPIATLSEAPEIEVHLVASDDERPHGLGEPTVCPFAPAVLNAVAKLTGRRLRRLPVRAADLA